jgi:thiol-disulfide isomerase/thioredoxin
VIVFDLRVMKLPSKLLARFVVTVNALLVLQSAAENIAGIGVALTKTNHAIIVHQIIPKSTVAQTGVLKIGDEILAVAQADGVSIEVDGKTLDEVVAMIRGPKGSIIYITFQRLVMPRKAVRMVTKIERGLLDIALPLVRSMVKPGERLPAKEVKLFFDLGQNSSLSTSDWLGKIVVLEVWATWCPPCLKSVADLQNFIEKHSDLKASVSFITVSVDEDFRKAERLVQVESWSQTINYWGGPSFAEHVGASALPMLIIANRYGDIISVNESSLEQILRRAVKEH